ncbi:MAG: glycosyltransferase family 2 protein [Clostridiales bacterium]|nr:glycosyltransferase family 2 protein [Clostridiales bacterium]
MACKMKNEYIRSNMFISFIVPVYNGEVYLAECLDSLFRQGVPEETYEVIVVDDGSTDGTRDILASYSAAKSNFWFFTQDHRGVSAARNLGLREAQGDYVWFVDADDFIQDNAIDELMKITDNRKIDRVIFDAYQFTEELTTEEMEKKASGRICTNSGSGAVAVWASIFRRLFLIEHGKAFNEGLSMAEDTLFLYELQFARPEQFCFHKVLYFWRRNPTSTTMSETKITQLSSMESRLRFMTQMKEYYQNRKGDLAQCADYLMSNLWPYLMNTAGLDRKSSREALRRVKEIGLFPIRRPPECTLRKTYMSTRTDLFGKVFDFIGTHLHRRWGFAVMRLYNLIKRSR